MTCQEHTRALLDVAMATLAMQREIIALRAQVEAMRRPAPWITPDRIETLISWIGSFLKSGYGQSLIAGAIGLAAAGARWLLGQG